MIEDAHGYALIRPTLVQRATARLRSSSLDLALAGGASPEADLLLALRAAHLAKPRTRRALARGLRRTVHAATAAGSPPPVLPSPLRRRIARAAAELGRLTETLVRPGPLPVRGIARTVVLLTHAGSPLHSSGAGSLADCVEDIVIDLRRLSW